MLAVAVYPVLRPPDLIRMARNNTQGGNEPNAKERSGVWMHFIQKSNDYAESNVTTVEISLKAGFKGSAKFLHVVFLCFAVN